MKQTSKVLILLVILAATLFLTGCPKEPEVADPTADKGSWVTKTFSYSKSKDASYSATHKPDYFSADTAAQTISFDFDYSQDREAAKYTDDQEVLQDYYKETSTFKSGVFKTFDFSPYLEPCIGFEVCIKKNAGSEGAGYGIDFLYGKSPSGNYYTYYVLLLDNDSYCLEYYDGSEIYYLARWEASTSIRPVGQENVVKVATHNDGKIGLYINGVLQGTITPPAESAVQGRVFALGGVGFDDITAATASDVNITWKFNKFQQ